MCNIVWIKKKNDGHYFSHIIATVCAKVKQSTSCVKSKEVDVVLDFDSNIRLRSFYALPEMNKLDKHSESTHLFCVCTLKSP